MPCMEETKEVLSEVLRAVEEKVHRRVTEVQVLSGGLTNENYTVTLEDGLRLVVRLPGQGTGAYIDRAAEMTNAAAVGSRGIGPKVYYFDPKTGASAVQFLEGKTLSEEAFTRPEVLQAAGELLSRCHRLDLPFANDFRPLEQIRTYLRILGDRKIGYEHFAKAQQAISRCGEALEKYPARRSPCHNDPRADNFMVCRGKLTLIDWEYSGRNDGYCDLACVCTENHLTREQEEILLAAYCGGAPTDRQREHLLMARFVIAAHWSLWALVQAQSGKDAAFYEDYGVDHYREVLRAMTDPGFPEAMRDLEKGLLQQ